MVSVTASAPYLFVSTFWAAIVRFNQKGGWIMSSHVAMSVMLALFPFLLFVVALAGFLSQDLDVGDLIELFFGTWPDAIAAPIETEVRKVLSASGSGLLSVGGVLAVFFASNGVNAVRAAMSRAYMDDDTRSFVHTRLLALAFVLVGGGGILLTATLSVVFPIYYHLFSDVVPSGFARLFSDARINAVFTLVVLSSAVAACHVWLPGQRHRLADIWPGVILTVAMWVVAGIGLSIYMARFADYSATYAGLAGVIAALVFLNLMAAILILGAEFNGARLERQAGQGARP